MKKEVNMLKILLIMGIIIIAGVIIFVFTKSQADYSKLTQVRIKVMGTMVPSGDEYTLSLKDGKWVASHNRIEWLEENTREKIVDDSFVNKIKGILNENTAHKWNSYNIKYELKKKIGRISTDGTNYSFYMSFSDGTIITVEEYNIYPDTYMSVLNAFKKEFENLFDESK